MPTKVNISSKTDFALRPSVPSSQKQSATEFNSIVAAINSNYERLMVRWATDIPINTQMLVGQYILFTDEVIYRVHTTFNVGSPITWDATKVTQIGGSGVEHFRGGYDASGNVFPTTGGSGGGAPVDGDYYYLTVGGTLNGEVWPAQSIIMLLTGSTWRIF